jgi:hypothetical protein
LAVITSKPQDQSADEKGNKTATPFRRKCLVMLQRKIDYLLSWTSSYSDRVAMLDVELEQVLPDLKAQLEDHQRDKERVERNLARIRLSQRHSEQHS